MIGNKSRVHVTAALAALWLTACGGGGGGDSVVVAPPPAGNGPSAPAPAPTPAPGPAPAPAPTPAPSPAPTPAPAPAPLTFAATSAPAQVYHWVASSADGQVLAAGALPGDLLVSRDGGTTWAAGTGLPAYKRLDVVVEDTKGVTYPLRSVVQHVPAEITADLE